MNRTCKLMLAGALCVAAVSAAAADEGREEVNCDSRAGFIADGWQQKPVQAAMDAYLRDHRMRANWMHEPRPPDAVGRDYYEWLWTTDFGAAMKQALVQRFCAGAPD
jgi:hypothetical protein